MNWRKIVTVVICIVVFSAVSLSGCNKSGSTPDEVDIPTVVTESTSEVSTTLVSSEPEKTTVQTEAQQEEVFVPVYNSEDAEDVEDESNKTCIVNVDGKTYTYYIGDVFFYVFYLKTPEALEDFQATTNYDSFTIELIETSVQEMFPVAGEVVVCNTDMQNTVKFNAINLSGMDFTKGGDLISLKFRVIDQGSTAISTTLEYMDSILSEPYVSDYKIIGDIQYSEEIK